MNILNKDKTDFSAEVLVQLAIMLECVYAAMEAAEKGEDMYGPFDSVADLMEALSWSLPLPMVPCPRPVSTSCWLVRSACPISSCS